MPKGENMDCGANLICSNDIPSIQAESRQRQILSNKSNNYYECENYSSDQNCMERMYLFLDELGSGGFGKVKLAKHILTGDQVAIKIIDKKSIPNDLPRVFSEMEALKLLAHQNICRLFQFRETEDRLVDVISISNIDYWFYIVMEYCNGGEMFDYIVRKERLGESEARHFFRQCTGSRSGLHSFNGFVVILMFGLKSLGFAHRDLKPENLLLTQELQLKVIDFGLCARPLNGLTRPLETCCGSPAYAAPELIQNQSYFGNEADIWSMGVLLYALLCDDTNMPRLYKQITLGQYFEPDFLSQSCKDLLRSMLTVDPKKRATIQQILVHPWLNSNYEQQIKWQSIYNRDIVDEEIIRELVCFFKINTEDMIARIKQWRFDYICATYLILLQRKEQKKNFALPFYDKNFNCNFPCSPTIHSSLENDLDLSGFEDIIKFSNPDNANEIMTEKLKSLALLSPPVFTNTKQMILPPIPSTFSPYEGGKQGQRLDANSITPRKPQQRKPSYEAPTHHRPAPSNKGGCSVYTTPRRGTVELPGSIVGGFAYRRPNSVDRPPSLRLEKNDPADENSPPSLHFNNNTQKTESCERRSRIDMCRAYNNCNNNIKQLQNNKSPHRFRQRVFSSLERKADKMISLLTPKKIKSEAPTKLKCTEPMANVSVTSSSDPVKVREELWKVLCNLGMNATQNGWKVSGCRKNSNNPKKDATVELEVVSIEGLQYVGVKRRRVHGEPFTYKRICEEVLRLAGL
uniref:non-specific serine/threonine protein kinase n=2 Tax=Meloidogyne TaxID=189290 RepID=A0A915P8Z7_9BILA